MDGRLDKTMMTFFIVFIALAFAVGLAAFLSTAVFMRQMSKEREQREAQEWTHEQQDRRG